MASKSRDWHQQLGRLVDRIGDEAFPSMLMRTIEHLVAFDDAVVLAYSREHVPVILHDQLQPGDRELFHTSYFSGVYLASPFYQAFERGEKSGVYRLRSLAPDRFYQSEYYRRYYRHIGARDLLSYLFPASGDWALLISIGRQSTSNTFAKSEIKKLDDVAPVLHSLALRHWANPWNSGARTQDLHQTFKQRFDAFGQSLLTRRELDVLRLLMMGHSAKSIAGQLTITHETVRVHRKNIYRKMQVNSQGELFSRFIEELTSGEVI